jgi:hypothetical protein
MKKPSHPAPGIVLTVLTACAAIFGAAVQLAAGIASAPPSLTDALVARAEGSLR